MFSPQAAVFVAAALSAAASAEAFLGPSIAQVPQMIQVNPQQADQFAQQLQQQLGLEQLQALQNLKLDQLQALQNLKLDQLQALQNLPQLNVDQLPLLDRLNLNQLQQMPQIPAFRMDQLPQLQQQLQQQLPTFNLAQQLQQLNPLAMTEGLASATSFLPSMSLDSLSGGGSFLPFLAPREETEDTEETTQPPSLSMDVSQLVHAVKKLAPFLSQETAQQLASSLTSGNPLDLTETKEMLQQAAAAAAAASSAGLPAVPFLPEHEAQHIAEALAALSPFVPQGISLTPLADRRDGSAPQLHYLNLPSNVPEVADLQVVN